MKTLIIGMGRAGQRHAKLLENFGVDWNWLDPYSNLGIPGQVDWEDVSDKYDLGLICTPPALHLDHIELCLEQGIKKILCEKPLCDFGEVERARKLGRNDIAVAYNWRWHPAYENWTIPEQSETEWVLYSNQQRRDIPAWGLLLDHVAHSIDLLRFLSGYTITEVAKAEHRQMQGFENWVIEGRAGPDNFRIIEQVCQTEVGREAWVKGPTGKIEPAMTSEAINLMFARMWKDVFRWVERGGETPLHLYGALETQKALELINDATSR